jgi:hypothetical protein
MIPPLFGKQEVGILTGQKTLPTIKSIFTSEVYTVFKVEYFLYIIQIMLQYTPSFNKVCYTLRLQGAFYKYIKLNIMQVQGNLSMFTEVIA